MKKNPNYPHTYVHIHTRDKIQYGDRDIFSRGLGLQNSIKLPLIVTDFDLFQRYTYKTRITLWENLLFRRK